VRVFAALPLPSGVVSSLEEALAPARRVSSGLRWVSAGGFHVTLHFFGEVGEPGVAALQRVFDDPDLRMPAIPLRLGKIGQFPSRGNPRVLWVGFEQGVEVMRSYWDLLEKKISPLGWVPDERGFSPHVTVARAGKAGGSGENLNVEIPPIDFSIEECVLFQSILGHAGAQYLALKRISLKREGG
jgi:2'-5' RNA ligase